MKGVDVTPYAVHVKGIEVGAHGIRSDADFLAHDIGYAASVQGGVHSSLAVDGYSDLSASVFRLRRCLQLLLFLGSTIAGLRLRQGGHRLSNNPRQLAERERAKDRDPSEGDASHGWTRHHLATD